MNLTELKRRLQPGTKLVKIFQQGKGIVNEPKTVLEVKPTSIILCGDNDDISHTTFLNYPKARDVKFTQNGFEIYRGDELRIAFEFAIIPVEFK